MTGRPSESRYANRARKLRQDATTPEHYYGRSSEAANSVATNSIANIPSDPTFWIISATPHNSRSRLTDVRAKIAQMLMRDEQRF